MNLLGPHLKHMGGEKWAVFSNGTKGRRYLSSKGLTLAEATARLRQIEEKMRAGEKA